jgi:hypothetical protein
MHNCNARWPKRDLRICHAKPVALAIRLLRDASFQKKNASTRQQKSNEKSARKRALLMFHTGCVRAILTKSLALRYLCRSLISLGSIVQSGPEK